MKRFLYVFIVLFFGLYNISNAQANSKMELSDSIIKVEMFLSALGLEVDDFPSINVTLDFVNDSSICIKTFYNPKYENSTYSLNKEEMQIIKRMLQNMNLEKIKKEYTSNISDQPRSTMTIYTTKNTFIFNDYGLQGEYPLKELYKLVYKY